VDDSSDFSSRIVDQSAGTLTTFTPPALPYGTIYWRVQARDAAGNWSAWSAVYRLTVTILRSPLNSAYMSDSTPTLVWFAVPGVAQYQLKVDKLDAPMGTIINQMVPAPTVSFTPGALPYGHYSWSVQVNGQWMPAWTFTITASTPAAPGLITPAHRALTNLSTPLAFNWTAPVQIITSTSFRSTTRWTSAAEITSSPTDHLRADQLRRWALHLAVRAITAGMAGEWSALRTFTVDQTPPAAPALLLPADQAGTTRRRPTFSWGAVVGAVRYELQTSTNGVTFSPDPGYPSATTALASPVDLPLGTNYWRVRAIDAAGNVGPSSAAFRLFVSATAPAVPAQPTLSSPPTRTLTNTGSQAFAWNAALNAVTYQFQLDDDLVVFSSARRGCDPASARPPTTRQELADARLPGACAG
jgi:hypothetical protein